MPVTLRGSVVLLLLSLSTACSSRESSEKVWLADLFPWAVWPEIAAQAEPPASGSTETVYVNVVSKPEAGAPVWIPVLLDLTQGRLEIISALQERQARIVYADVPGKILVSRTGRTTLTVWRIVETGQVVEAFSAEVESPELTGVWVDRTSGELLAWGSDRQVVRDGEHTHRLHFVTAVTAGGAVRWRHTLPLFVQLYDARSGPTSDRWLVVASDERSLRELCREHPTVDIGGGTPTKQFYWLHTASGVMAVLQEYRALDGVAMHPSHPIALAEWLIDSDRKALGLVASGGRRQARTYASDRYNFWGFWLSDYQAYLIRRRPDAIFSWKREYWAMWDARTDPMDPSMRWHPIDAEILYSPDPWKSLSNWTLSSRGNVYAVAFEGKDLRLEPVMWVGDAAPPPRRFSLDLDRSIIDISLPQAPRIVF